MSRVVATLMLSVLFVGKLSGGDVDAMKLLEEIRATLEMPNKKSPKEFVDGSYNPFDPSVLMPLEKKKEEKSDTENNQTELTPALTPMKLQAIFGKNMVMIDGYWYKRGEMVGDYKVVSIYSNTVLLKNGTDSLKLKLFEDNLLKEDN